MEIDLENLPEQKSRLQNIIAHLASKNKELVQSNIVLSNQYKAVSEEHKTISQKYTVLSAEHEVFQIKYKEAVEENERLKEKLKLLRAKSFGKSSEKLKKEIDHLALQIEDNEISLGLTLDIDNIKESEEKKSKHAVNSLDYNIPDFFILT